MAAMTPTTKCLALAALGAILAQVSYARTPAQAHSQVRSWVASHPNAFGRTLHRPSGVVLTAKKLGTNIFHSVSLESGGFAVVADSEGVLLAFSEEGTFSQTNAAPLWAMLLANTGAVVPERRRGPRLLSQAEISTTTLPEGISVAETTVAATAPKLMASTKISSTSSISDLRVPPLLKSKWGQSTNNGKRIYNYYTPYNSVCGCVATAMSQIMRYHEYPTSKVTAETKACCYDGAVTNLTMQGGTYNWSEMPLVPSSSISISQQQAIGKLTSDAGISVHMQYTKKQLRRILHSCRLCIDKHLEIRTIPILVR